MLLLKRSSAHNDQKWGLPGGNVEEGDKDLIDTAKREATEEMGTLPPFDVKGEILTVYAPEARSRVLYSCSMSNRQVPCVVPSSVVCRYLP